MAERASTTKAVSQTSAKDQTHALLSQLMTQGGARGVPKYIRLQEVVIELIQQGRWKSGDRLPTEKEMAVLSGFSLGTVQRAFRDLFDQGIVDRRQGLATFVTDNEHRMQNPWHCRFLDDDDSKVLPVYAEVLKRNQVNEQDPWTRWIGKGPTFRVDRRLNIGGEFNVFSRFYAKVDVLDYLWNCPLTELNGANFKILIARECGIPITHIMHNLRLMEFPPQIRRIVNMKSTGTGIYLYAVAHAGRGNCVYYQEYFIPPTHRFLHFSESFGGLNGNGRG